jgi:hypothetical protein
MAGLYGRLMMGHPGTRAPVAPPPVAQIAANRMRAMQSMPPGVQRMLAAQRPPTAPPAVAAPGLVRPTLPNGQVPPPQGMPPPGAQVAPAGPQGIPPQILQLLQQRQMQGAQQPPPPQALPPPPAAPQQSVSPEMLQQFLASMRAQGG